MNRYHYKKKRFGHVKRQQAHVCAHRGQHMRTEQVGNYLPAKERDHRRNQTADMVMLDF